MRSHLLEGRVRHRRLRPFAYELDHAVHSFELDLDELDIVAERSRLIARNRRGIVTFHDRDHLPEPAADLAVAVRAHLRDEGVDPGGWTITVVTSLRILGYVFNPASFYLCRDAAGELSIVIVEVHNTHGERHLYTLHADPASPGRFAAGMSKAFYVSPFIPMEGRYSVFVRDGAERLSIAITEGDGDGPLLTTSLVLRRLPLSDRILVRLLLRHPLMTHRTIGLIHWHALRLWLKGAPFLRHGAASRGARAERASSGVTR
jgi:uncharacterized protein